MDIAKGQVYSIGLKAKYIMDIAKGQVYYGLTKGQVYYTN